MLLAYLSILLLLVALASVAERRGGGLHRAALARGWQQLRPLLVRLPPALLAASFLAALVPPAWFARTLGDASGLPGVLIASALGGLLPGGPMVSFPLALVLFRAGVGAPQMVALLTAWSVLALHRVFAFELPTLGWGFVWRRWLVSLLLPPLAGALAVLAGY